MKSRYYFTRPKEAVRVYVKSCDVCQRCKSNKHLPTGYIEHLWHQPSDGILFPLIGFRYHPSTKMVTCSTQSSPSPTVPASWSFFSTRDTATASQTAQAFQDEIVPLHSLPSSSISDRVAILTSIFWRQLMNFYDIDQHLYFPVSPASKWSG